METTHLINTISLYTVQVSEKKLFVSIIVILNETNIYKLSYLFEWIYSIFLKKFLYNFILTFLKVKQKTLTREIYKISTKKNNIFFQKIKCYFCPPLHENIWVVTILTDVLHLVNRQMLWKEVIIEEQGT